MNKKIKIIIALLTTFLVLLFAFLLIKSFSSEKIEENDFNEEEFVDIEDMEDILEFLSEEDLERVASLRKGPLANIENKVPANAKYSIKYIEKDEFLREPIFEITIDAKNWDEFITIEKEAMQLFTDLGVSPHEYPLKNQIHSTVLDWANFNFESSE